MIWNRGRARRLFDEAVAAEHEGDLEHAVATLEQAVRLWPRNAAWHYRLGRLHERREAWLTAARALETAVRLDPTRSTWHYRLGRMRYAAWDLAGACEAYTMAVKLDPTRERWAERLARAEQRLETFTPFQGLLVAHRGRATGPENALEGLTTLPSHVNGVEVDVRLTSDGVPVLMHDRQVDRTTDGTGEVAEFTFAQLQQVQLHGGGRIPRLADYLRACADQPLTAVLIDVKEPTSRALHAVAADVRSSPVADRCIVLVRRPDALREFRAIDSDLRLGMLRTRKSNVDERLAAARETGAEVLFVDHGDDAYLQHRIVTERIRAAGIRAGASTINSRRALEAARVDGCDVIMTDVIAQLAHYCRS